MNEKGYKLNNEAKDYKISTLTYNLQHINTKDSIIEKLEA